MRLFLDCPTHGANSPALLICKHVDPDDSERRPVCFSDEDTRLCHACLHEQNPEKMGFACMACFNNKTSN